MTSLAQASILSLLFEDHFGLWEIRGECEKENVPLEDMIKVFADLLDIGAVIVYAKAPNGGIVPLPQGFSVLHEGVWDWPGEANIFYWAGLSPMVMEWFDSMPPIGSATVPDSP